MSRYDGLIIPRSYSEYINKTDAATLQQALQLSGVLSNTVQSNDKKPIQSEAVLSYLNKNMGQQIVFDNTQSSAQYKGYWYKISISLDGVKSIPIQNSQYNYINLFIRVYGSNGQAVYCMQYNRESINIVCLKKSDSNIRLYATFVGQDLYILALTTWGAYIYISDIVSNKIITSVTGEKYSETLYNGIETKPDILVNTIYEEIV